MSDGEIGTMKEISKEMLFGDKPDFSYNEGVRHWGHQLKQGSLGTGGPEVFRNSVEGMGRGVMQEAEVRAQVNRKAEKGEKERVCAHEDRLEQAGLYVNPLPFFSPAGLKVMSTGKINHTFASLSDDVDRPRIPTCYILLVQWSRMFSSETLRTLCSVEFWPQPLMHARS